MTKKKKPTSPDSALAPVLTSSDLEGIQSAQTLRDKLQLIYQSPCHHCGAATTIPNLAKRIGVNERTLWRFIHGKQTTLMEENFKKIAEWVNGQK